jgi:hypothetical protein
LSEPGQERQAKLEGPLHVAQLAWQGSQLLFQVFLNWVELQEVRHEVLRGPELVKKVPEAQDVQYEVLDILLNLHDWQLSWTGHTSHLFVTVLG